MENKNMPIIIGENVKFERVRRITGYLTGTIDRWNNAKRCEEAARIKHLSASNISKQIDELKK